MDEPTQAVAIETPFSRKVLVFLSPAPPQAGCWCSRRERRPYVRLIVLGNEPRRRKRAQTSDTGQPLETYHPENDPLDCSLLM